jgi:hypothetical protein
MTPYKVHGIDCIPREWRCKHQDSVMRERPWLCWQCTAEDAWKLYKKVNQTYRNGTPVMEDQRFDVFENFLRSRHPEDKRFWSVGETK